MISVGVDNMSYGFNGCQGSFNEADMSNLEYEYSISFPSFHSLSRIRSLSLTFADPREIGSLEVESRENGKSGN